jgi:antitoxin VapB
MNSTRWSESREHKAEIFLNGTDWNSVEASGLLRNRREEVICELELLTSEATIHREGKRLVIEPVERTSLLDMVATWEPLDIEFPELADEKPAAVEL